MPPVPSIIVHPPTTLEKASTSNAAAKLVEKVAAVRALGSMRRRPREQAAVSSHRRVRSGSMSKLFVAPRSASDPPPTTTTHHILGPDPSRLTPEEAYARPLPRRGRHTICGTTGPLPVLPPLQLGTPFEPAHLGVDDEVETVGEDIGFYELPSLKCLPSDLREALAAVLGEAPNGRKRSESMSTVRVEDRIEDKADGKADDKAVGDVEVSEVEIEDNVLEMVDMPDMEVKEVAENKTEDTVEDMVEEMSDHGTVYVDAEDSTSPPSLWADSAPSSPISDDTHLLTPTPRHAPLLLAPTVRLNPPSPQLRHRTSTMSIATVHTIRRKPVKRTIIDKLDGEAFPQIIDKVLSYVPSGQLASLRKVNTGFRDWVDRYLCYHVTLESYGNVNEHAGAAHLIATVHRFDGNNRVKVWERVLREYSEMDAGLEEVPDNIIPVWMLARTRCVEVRGPLGRTDVSQFAEGLLNIQTVRLCENGLGHFPDSCPFSAENIVAVHSRSLPTDRCITADDDRTCHLPDGVKRLLINVHHNVVHNNGRGQRFSFPPSLKEVGIRFIGHLPTALHTDMSLRPSDFIFHQIGPLRPGIKYSFIDAINFGPLWNLPPPPKEPSGVLRRLVPKPRKKKSINTIEHVSHMTSKDQRSQVGLLTGLMYQVNRRSAEDSLLALLREAIASNQKRWKLADLDIIKQISFLSLGEYRSRVARQQFVMEMTE